MSADVWKGTYIPGMGTRYELHGKTLIIDFSCVIESLTPEQAFVFIEATDEYLSAGEAENSNLPRLQRRRLVQEFITKPIYQPFTEDKIFKFVSESAYKRFYSKGQFQFGTLSTYRPLELMGNAAGDRLEGKAYCFLKSPTREYYVGVYAGFDRYIGSFTENIDDCRFMARKFGPIILEFDAKLFMDRAAEELGASTAETGQVRYADLKIVKGETIGGIPDESVPHLDKWLFEELYRLAEPTALFVKPRRFRREQEIRIALQMDREVSVPHAVTFPDHRDLWRRIV